MTATYLSDDVYNRLIADLLSAHTGFDARTRVIELLGETANVWPASVAAEPEHAPTAEEVITTPLADLRANVLGATETAIGRHAPTITSGPLEEIMLETSNEIDRQMQNVVDALRAQEHTPPVPA